MKKFITLLLIFTILFTAFNFLACGDTPKVPGGENNKEETVIGTEGLTYKINGQGENRYATFTGLSKSCTATEIVIASHYDGVLVTEVGSGYAYLSNMANVEKVNIHKYVKVVNASAFAKATNLKEVNFDEDAVLDSMGSSAFKNCAKLETLNLPKKILSMGEDVLSGCDSLIPVEYEGAKYLGGGANPHFILISGVNGAKNCKVSEECQTISANAFKDNATLETITFESDDTLTSIGASAFSGATSLKSITIPKTCKTIGVEAFLNCISLETLTFAKDNAMESIGERAFSTCIKLREIVNFEECDIATLSKQVFLDSVSLVSIVIPNTVTYIDNWALGVLNYENPSLESIVFEEGSKLEHFHQSCFRNLEKLKSIIIPGTVTSLDRHSFVGTGGTIIYMGCTEYKDTFRVGYNAATTYTGEIPPEDTVWCPTYYYSPDKSKSASEVARGSHGVAGTWHYVNGVPTPW